MVTWQQIGQGEPNPFDVTYTTNSPYSASYGEFVITEGDQVDLPSPQANAAVAVRSFEQRVTITTPSGNIRDSYITGGVYLNSPRYVILVSDGTNWYVQNNESGIGPAIPDSGVARWTLDNADTDSGTAIDVWGRDDDSITQTDATINGATTGVSGANQTYTTNEGCSFDGGSDYLNAGSIQPQPMSVAYWVKLDNTTTENVQSAAYNPDTGDKGHIVRMNGDVLQITVNNTRFNGTTSLSTGQWYHIVLALGGSDSKLYLNGSEEISTTTINNVSNADFLFGARKGGAGNITGFLSGDMDDARLYDKQLSALEASNLYNTGSI